MRGLFRLGVLGALVAVPLALQACSHADDSGTSDDAVAATDISAVKHIVVLFMENHSFDNLYGEFEGADGVVGLSPAAANVAQIDENGAPYPKLPMPMKADGGPSEPRLPLDLPNAPFVLDDYIPTNATPPDLHHNFLTEQHEIHGGAMNQYALWSDARGLTMGHYHTANLPMHRHAKSFVLCDRFFHAAFGGSFLNHQWLIAARTPEFGPNAPEKGAMDESKLSYGDNESAYWFDSSENKWFAVNTNYSAGGPHPTSAPTATPVPLQTYDTIGDRLTAAGVDWAWFSGGWNVAAAWQPDSGAVSPATVKFQYHHQPFVYFARYQQGQPGYAHLKDEEDFLAAARAGTLPAVSFVKPAGIDNEHPGYADVARGDTHAAMVVDTVMSGPNWKDTAIIVAYDEHGGFWDHVSPPRVDKWGPGARVPAMVISPFAKRGFVDHTVYDTTSILATIEKRFGLTPLTSRDARAKDLSAAFDFKPSP